MSKIAALYERAQTINGQAHVSEAEQRELDGILGLLEEVTDLADAGGHRDPAQPRIRPGSNPPPVDNELGRAGLFGAGQREARSFAGDRLMPAAVRNMASAVREAMLNPTEKPRSFKNSMSEGVGEDGGFAVPPGWYGGLLDESLEVEQLRPLCNVIPMTGPQVTVPAFDNTTQTGAKRANLQLVWADELSTQTDQTAKLRTMTLR